MTNLELNSLRSEVAGLERQSAEVDAAALRLALHVKARRLDLLRAEGQGDSLEAQWIVAWLAGQNDEARRICSLMYPESKPTPLRLVPATPFDAEAAADAEDLGEFGSPTMAHDLGCVMGDDSGDDEQRSARGA